MKKRDQALLDALERIATSIDEVGAGLMALNMRLDALIENTASGGVLRMKDTERAAVYSKHLGEKLRP